MKWEPKKIIDVHQQLPKFNLLKTALEKLFKYELIHLPGSIKETLSDEMGTYGYRTPQFILVAKDKPYGNIVSCHYSAMLRCMEHEVPLIMYIGESKKYYIFYSDDIMKNNEGINHKGKAKMINFNIKQGKRAIVSQRNMRVVR